ncbi:MAG: family 20 glycosylhydrolase [Gemmatimonadota bacterium]|nr:family 20 glycosylhydrolase [Gemmatimonadota bacterium]
MTTVPRSALLSLAAALSLTATLTAQAPPRSEAVDALLPRPTRAVADLAAGALPLGRIVTIAVPAGSPRLREVGALLGAELQQRTGRPTRVVAGVAESGRRAEGALIRLDTSYQASNDEAYALTVGARGAAIHAASSRGALWGVQTLLQLLEPADSATWQFAAARVDDAPRFGWRGSLVDVGRHWFPVRDIERHIDLLARHKMNVLHWHLTEDQGWRIEIRRYPRLTAVAAWRTERDGTRYGGYYTQREVRHLVEYARQRGVTVVPEIEMPGHSSAALAAYPNLGCTADTIAVPNSWGVFADIYCAGKEETFTFLFNVLDEVMDLFPSPIIHIGGDEAPKDRWKECAPCQAVMKREHLADEEALQSWFMGRVAAHVAKRGRRVIGWDEVLDGPYIAGGLVQSWRDSSFTRAAVARGHDVVASPNAFTYINQSANQVSLASVYQFDPVPPGFDAASARRVLGGEVTLWSEHITSGANLELMTLPRLAAFAEILWSAAPRDLPAFERRLALRHLPRLRDAGFAVGPSDAPLATIAVRVDTSTRRAVVRMPALAAGVTVRATRDGSRPSAESLALSDGDAVDAPDLLRMQPFWGASPILEERRVAFARHPGVGARVTLRPLADARYPGTGTGSLTDGLLGGSEHGDGLWQGWWGPDLQAELDLGAARRVASVTLRCLQNVRSWIVLPARVEVAWSTDGKDWHDAGVARHTVPVSREGVVLQPFTVALPSAVDARYLRVTARSAGALPAGHTGAGQASWLFADEIIVR